MNWLERMNRKLMDQVTEPAGAGAGPPSTPASMTPDEPKPGPTDEPVVDPPVEPSPTPTEPVGVHAAMSSEDKDRLLNLYSAQIQENTSSLNRLAEVEAELATLRAGPPPSQDDETKRYYAEPVQVLRDELATAIAPLKEFVSGMQSDNAAVGSKAQVKANYPQLADVFDGGLAEKMLNDGLKGVEPTAENVRAVAFGVKGMIAAGVLTPTQPGQPVQPGVPVVLTPTNPALTPPAVTPSAPPAPAAPAPVLRELTENERRIAKEWGMTPGQFLAGQGAPEVSVAPLIMTDEGD